MTIDVTDDPGLVRAMAPAGYTVVFVGFESPADANPTEAGKRTTRAADDDRAATSGGSRRPSNDTIGQEAGAW